MNFTIYFKEISILSINGSKRTFNKDTKYGFIDIDKKEVNKIRKACLKNSNMIFSETTDFSGCSEIIRKATTSKDVTVENLITMNKKKKNKNGKNLVSKSLKNKSEENNTEEIIENTTIEEVVEENKEVGENGLTNENSSNIIESGDENNE